MNDIILTETGEVLIHDNDFVVAESLLQNETILLVAHEGDFKATPDVGVGLSDLLLSTDLLEYRHRIKDHFRKDGLYVKNLDLYDVNKIKIDADYE